MSSFCKSHFFSKNISIYAIFDDQSFNNKLTNDIVSFEQLGLDGIVAQFNQGLHCLSVYSDVSFDSLSR